MPAGRFKKPTELKKLEGTYRKDRDSGSNSSADVEISKTYVIVSEEDRISVPKTLTTKESRKYYKMVVDNLRVLRVLSRVDLKQIETLCLYIERMDELNRQLAEIDIATDFDDWAKVSNQFDRVSKRFDELAAKFYITPQARVQLKLSELNAIRTSQEITKNDNAINNLLSMRKASD